MSDPRDPEDSNVSSFTDAKEKRRGRPPKPPSGDGEAGKIEKAVLYQAISDAIIKRKWSTLPEFPGVRFVIYEPATGGRVIATLDDMDVVTLQENDTAIEKAIMRYCSVQLADKPHYRFTSRTVKEVKDFWYLYAPDVKDVAPVRWLSEEGYTFNRLPWDPGTGGTPTWDKLLGRVSNADCFKQWIGSLFFEKADIQQYVWLHGLGGDGKGAISRFLARVFGNSFASKQPPGMGDRFWSHGLIGKRIVVFPDCNNTSFVSSGIFKSLTGGDPISVEAKGKMSYTYLPRCKYLFFSNERPKISSEPADQRRIIYCEVTGKAAYETDFEDRLWAEGGDFLGSCLSRYQKANPNHRPIVVPEEFKADLDAWVSVVEEQYEVIYEKHFVRPAHPYDTTDGLAGMDPDAAFERCVPAHRMQAVLGLHFKYNNQKSGEFLKWMEIKHGIKKCRLYLRGGQRAWGYVGIAEPDNLSSDY